MRKTIPAVLAASLTLALVAATAQAQTLRAGPASPTGSTSSTNANTLARPTPGSSNSTTGAAGTSGTADSSGTTNGSNSTSLGGAPSTTSTSASGSSRGNAPPMGAASQNNSSNSMGTNFNANGERLGVFNPGGGVVVGSDAGVSGSGSSGIDTANNGSANANSAVGDAGRMGVATTPELDRATRREAQRTRRTVESKGQMMHSIAPRTNVDRTDQMPDDNTLLLSPGRP